MKGKTEFQLSDILIPETGYGRKAKKKGESGENERSYVRKPVGWWVKNSALTHWTRESSTNREFCKPVSKFLLQKPVYVKQDHLFFISYCRHLFVRSDLATLKDMLMHRSQIATAGTPEYARIWNSTADVDLMLYFLWWSEKKKKRNARMHKTDSQGRFFSCCVGWLFPKELRAGWTNVWWGFTWNCILHQLPGERDCLGESPLWIISWLTDSGPGRKA